MVGTTLDVDYKAEAKNIAARSSQDIFSRKKPGTLHFVSFVNGANTSYLEIEWIEKDTKQKIKTPSVADLGSLSLTAYNSEIWAQVNAGGSFGITFQHKLKFDNAIIVRVVNPSAATVTIARHLVISEPEAK